MSYSEVRWRVRPISEYLRFKYDSGLLARLSNACNSVGMQYDLVATWGTYCELVHPEFLRLCEEHSLELVPLSIRCALRTRKWEIPGVIPPDKLVKISVFVSNGMMVGEFSIKVTA